jgi:hypothetical protein
MNFIMISGMPGALQVDPDQRRFCVIDAPAPMPPAFYRSVEYEIQSDGIEAFLDFLMRDLDMSDFDALTPPPMSRAPAMAA